MSEKIGRRGFIGKMGALGAAGLSGINLFSAGCGQSQPVPAPTGALPARGEFVVRDAYVMTMDPDLGDLSTGHIHVRNGEIVAVARDLQVPGAAVIDGRGMIALPGMVDTHWHMWNTLLRSFAGEKATEGYFPRTATLGKLMTPDDMYNSTRLAAAEAIHSGITTVHNYCHNVISREHSEADIRAMREAGLRGRWSYSWAQGHPDSQLIDLPALQALHRDWAGLSGEGRIALGLGWRGMFRPSGPLPPEIFRREFQAARDLGIPLSVHAGSAEGATGQIQALSREKLLGRDVQLVHALSASPAELRMIADAGSTISISPKTEMRIGYGMPKVSQLLDAGITVGVSVDNLVLAGNADFFGLLGMVRGLEKGRTHDEFKMTARRALELGTIEGARSLGIDNLVGSLKPGKRADLILVSTRRVNLGVFTDPAQMIIEAAQPENVDTVVADGRILKRGGQLTALPQDQILDAAAASLDGLRKRSNLL